MRHSRYGLRGVRLGEASNPGPPGRHIRDSAEEVLDNLERELTLVESDDEPLVRPTTGRNVVPRISAGEPILLQSDSLATVPALPPLPVGLIGSWMNQVRCSRSHVGARWSRNDEEVEEWAHASSSRVHEGREVPQVASEVPVPSHERLPSRRLVLVGGTGIGSQNCQSPEAQEDHFGETSSPLHLQVGWAQAVRAPLQAHQGRFAASARIDGSDDVGATQPADTPQPNGVEQEEQPHQRRRLRLLSQSTVTQVDSSGSETESLKFED